MNTPYLLISRFPVHPGTATALIEELQDTPDARVFEAMDGEEVLELRMLPAKQSLAVLSGNLNLHVSTLAPYLAGDIRRELLEFVEAPKPTASLLPETPFVQLRHVEVRPNQMQAYRDWRDRTIFDVVRNHDEVEVFLAYHSVISGQPGVMFVSGFSGSIEAYDAVFTSERYRQIVKQAGDQYITGGSEGLYTKIYCNKSMLAV